jgi:tRNA (cytidine56-2'-O)-methyltransferase
VWVSERDRELEKGVASAVDRFGGPFEVRTGVAWRQALANFDGVKVHLTMYGEPIDRVVAAVRRRALGRDLMVVVGGPKVPGEVYGLADFNVAVSNQPHSEVAALAIALDRFTSGAWARKKFEGARVAVRPSARGKEVVTVGEEE